MDWNRHEKNISEKATRWFEVIWKVLKDPAPLAEDFLRQFIMIENWLVVWSMAIISMFLVFDVFDGLDTEVSFLEVAVLTAVALAVSLYFRARQRVRQHLEENKRLQITASYTQHKLSPTDKEDWEEYLNLHRQRLLQRVDRYGCCFGCAVISNHGSAPHHDLQDLKASAKAGCLLCGLFLSEADQLSGLNGNVAKKVEVADNKIFLKTRYGEIGFDIVRTPLPCLKDYAMFATEVLLQRVYDCLPELGQVTTPFPMATTASIMEMKRRRGEQIINSQLRLLDRHPDGARCIALAQGWLKRCRSSHSRCIQSAYKYPPSRLLRIGDDAVYLEERKFSGKPPEYATLTYCWGKGETLTTTTETITSHKSGIAISKLPRTFCDAVRVAGWLGIRYIWIDALCILQDSENDWSYECNRMVSYYCNSIVTISALDATAANEGFLAPRAPVMIAPLYYEAAGDLWICRRRRNWKETFESAALNKRGWTLQERLLSTRVLHYSKLEMFWECLTCAASEGSMKEHQTTHDSSSLLYSEGEDFKRCLFTSGSDPYSIYDGAFALWCRFVTQYSRRQLTRTSDKLRAISGLAAKISEITKSKYISGIFVDDISSLCWIAAGGEPVRTTFLPLASSWSWASMWGQISYPFIDEERVISPSDAILVSQKHKDGRDCIILECEFKLISRIHDYFLQDYSYHCIGELISPRPRFYSELKLSLEGALAIRICQRRRCPSTPLSYKHVLCGRQEYPKCNCSKDRVCECTGPAFEDMVYFLVVRPVPCSEDYTRVGLGVSCSAALCSSESNRTPFTSSQRRRISLV